jgi:glycosyltransferase involved in cell wall biosynthesis
MPSILFINRVYPPSSGATGEMLCQLAEALAARRWDVTILATDTGGVPKDSLRNGARILRTGGLFSRKSTLLRAVSYGCMIPWLLIRALLLPRTDFIVTMTDPPMLAAIGPLIAFFKKNKIIHWAQDIYPEVAEELGVLPSGHTITRVLREVSSFALQRHDAVISIGRCMLQRMVARGIPAEKIHLIPNWAPPIAPCDKFNNPFRRQQGLEGDFVVAYSGNMGLAHDFDTILAVAESLRGRHIVFLMIGDGPRRAEIQRAANSRGLDNMRFLPSQLPDKLSESLSAADAHLVTMRTPLCGLVVPSKFYGVLAAGRPCLFVGPKESEVALSLTELDAGMVIDPENPSALAAAILDWAMDPVAHAAACRRARIAGASATITSRVDEFEKLLRGL